MSLILALQLCVLLDGFLDQCKTALGSCTGTTSGNYAVQCRPCLRARARCDTASSSSFALQVFGMIKHRSSPITHTHLAVRRSTRPRNCRRCHAEPSEFRKADGTSVSLRPRIGHISTLCAARTDSNMAAPAQNDNDSLAPLLSKALPSPRYVKPAGAAAAVSLAAHCESSHQQLNLICSLWCAHFSSSAPHTRRPAARPVPRARPTSHWTPTAQSNYQDKISDDQLMMQPVRQFYALSFAPRRS